MYDRIYLRLTFILVLILFFSCSDQEPVITLVSGKIVANVDNSYWISELATASLYHGEILISGESSDGSTISIRAGGVVEGIYQAFTGSAPDNLVYFAPPGSIPPPYASDYYYSNLNPSNTDGVLVGEVVIAEIDEINRTISGTFDADVANDPTGKTKHLKAGIFTKIPYSEYTSLLTESFSAKVNGNVYLPVEGISCIDPSNRIILQFHGANADGHIWLDMPREINTGDFFLDFQSTSYCQATYFSWEADGLYKAVSGEISIITHDKLNRRMVASFHFDGQTFSGEQRNVSITEGAFDIFY